jgi:hypothetical protein
MIFPVAPEFLPGVRILLLVVEYYRPRELFCFAGGAIYDGRSIGIVGDEHRAPLLFELAPRAYSSFDPAVLKDLIRPEQYASVSALLAGVEACVAIFANHQPPPGLVLRDAVYGLAESDDGRLMLQLHE